MIICIVKVHKTMYIKTDKTNHSLGIMALQTEMRRVGLGIAVSISNCCMSNKASEVTLN